MSHCLTESDLNRLRAQEMTPDEAERAHAHLATCPDCARRDAAMLAEHDDLVGRVRGIGDVGDASRPTPIPTATGSAGREVVGSSEDDVRRIGPYRLLEVLGEGGFGVVHLAEQTEPIRRRVALKIIKPGMDTRQVVSRFEAERQALAMMDHPNVARVLDAGTTQQGRPYFVMEHVPGLPITDYCDRHTLGTQERLELILPVCEAVQHAHQKGIIHRDIKPSNVLVTLQDGRPVPKVIDFGVAKAISHQLTAETIYTEQGQLIGTPEYMSPEQAEMTGLNVDTRTDVYSLGVLLYELLVGALPFDSKTLRAAGYAEIQRIIREDEPPKPSTRLSRLRGEPRTQEPGTHEPETPAPGQSPPHERPVGHAQNSSALPSPGPRPPIPDGSSAITIARQRRTDPVSLCKTLRGDLDWITMKAMDKDRTRRYATASELAADIRRHLEDQPVNAGPPSTAYRLRKFVRRHRLGVAAAAALTLAILLGVVGTSAMAWVASQRRVEAEHQADVAKTTLAFLQEFLASLDPMNPGDDNDDDGEFFSDERVGRAFADQPEVEAAVRAAAGTTFMHLGAYKRAEPHLRRALALRRDLFGEEHGDTLRSLNDLGEMLTALGRYPEALDLLGRAFDTRQRMLGDEHPDTLTSMNDYALCLQKAGRFAEAEPLVRGVLERRRKTLGPRHKSTLESANNLAFLHYHQGDLKAAEPLMRDVVDGFVASVGPEHPYTLTAKANLAMFLGGLERSAEAEPLHREVLEIRHRVLGDEHPDTALSKNNYGLFLYRQERYADAEPLYREALKTFRRKLGDEHENTQLVMANLATLYVEQDRHADARPLFEVLLEVRGHTKDPGRLEDCAALREYAELLLNLGDRAGAESQYRRVLAIQRRAHGPEHPETLQTQQDLFVLLYARGELEEAEGLLRDRVDILKRTSGDGDERTVDAANWLVLVLTSQEEFDEAEAIARKTLADSRRALGDDHQETMQALHGLSRVLDGRRQYADAERVTRELLEIRRRVLGASAEDTLTTMSNLGALIRKQGRLEDAEAVFKETIVLARESLGPLHTFVAVFEGEYGICLVDMARFDEAEPKLLNCHKILSGLLGERNEHPVRIARAIVRMYEAAGKPGRAARWRERADIDAASDDPGPVARPASGS